MLRNIKARSRGRLELLRWANEILETDYTKVEHMADGAAFCQLVDCCFPGAVPLHKVIFGAASEEERMHNLSLLQRTLDANDVAMDNFELLQLVFDLVQRKCPDAPASYQGRRRREEAAHQSQRRASVSRPRPRALSTGDGGRAEGEPAATSAGRPRAASHAVWHSSGREAPPAEEYTRSHSRSLLPSASEVVAQIAKGVTRTGAPPPAPQPSAAEREEGEGEQEARPARPVLRVGPYEAEDLEDLLTSLEADLSTRMDATQQLARELRATRLQRDRLFGRLRAVERACEVDAVREEDPELAASVLQRLRATPDAFRPANEAEQAEYE